MDRSYYATFEIAYESTEALQGLLSRLQVPLTALTNAPSFHTVNFVNDQGQLIAPVDILILRNTIAITVHPSAA